MSGMIGRKVGMTNIFDGQGNDIPCTVLEVGPNVVVQVKRSDESDGYDAVQLGFRHKKERRTTRALMGHFDKAGVSPRAVLREFQWDGADVEPGQEIRVEDVFAEGEMVDVAGTSKGKGFQGVVRRHGFKGVNDQTHGQHNRARAPGSIGASSDPSRVFKGTRMAGRMGGRRTKTKNLDIARIFPEHNLVLVRGAVPGAVNGVVQLYRHS